MQDARIEEATLTIAEAIAAEQHTVMRASYDAQSGAARAHAAQRSDVQARADEIAKLSDEALEARIAASGAHDEVLRRECERLRSVRERKQQIATYLAEAELAATSKPKLAQQFVPTVVGAATDVFVAGAIRATFVHAGREYIVPRFAFFSETLWASARHTILARQKNLAVNDPHGEGIAIIDNIGACALTALCARVPAFNGDAPFALSTLADSQPLLWKWRDNALADGEAELAKLIEKRLSAEPRDEAAARAWWASQAAPVAYPNHPTAA